jgi:hypothetical protein
MAVLGLVAQKPHRNGPMRILTAVSILALSLTSHAAHAQGRAVTGSAPGKGVEKVYSAEEGAALGAAVRKKAEDAERARDARLRRATSGICTGC